MSVPCAQLRRHRLSSWSWGCCCKHCRCLPQTLSAPVPCAACCRHSHRKLLLRQCGDVCILGRWMYHHRLLLDPFQVPHQWHLHRVPLPFAIIQVSCPVMIIKLYIAMTLHGIAAHALRPAGKYFRRSSDQDSAVATSVLSEEVLCGRLGIG